jgi:hypothetical protein
MKRYSDDLPGGLMLAVAPAVAVTTIVCVTVVGAWNHGEERSGRTRGIGESVLTAHVPRLLATLVLALAPALLFLTGLAPNWPGLNWLNPP